MKIHLDLNKVLAVVKKNKIHSVVKTPKNICDSSIERLCSLPDENIPHLSEIYDLKNTLQVIVSPNGCYN